jgi:alcohol dehydrogenase class IV
MEETDEIADKRTIAFISDFLASIGLSGRLRDHGVKAEQLDALAQQGFEDPCHRTNAVPVTKGDITNLYREVL